MGRTTLSFGRVFVAGSVFLVSLGANAAVVIGTPANNSIQYGTSVQVMATNTSGSASYMKLWVDHVANVVQQSTNKFNATVSLAPGKHLLEVQASVNGVVTTSGTTITLDDGSQPHVVVQTPANNSNVTGPSVEIYANTMNGTPSFMKLWVDHVALNQQSTGNYKYTVSNLSNGYHLIEVQAGVNGVTYTTPVNINVTPSTGPHVVIYSPLDGSTVNGPSVSVNANNVGGSSASQMKLWVDHVATKYENATNYFTDTINLSNGQHLIEVQATVNNVTYTTASMVNVTTSTNTGVTISPSSVSLLEGQTKQFSANQSVTWSVSGDGSISSSGLFTAGASPGTAVVTAKGASSSASAQVVVNSSSTNTYASKHVFFVMLENRSDAESMQYMPYVSGLAKQYGLSTQAYSPSHGSFLAYLEMAAGAAPKNGAADNGNCNGDGCKSGVYQSNSGDNIVRHLKAKGLSWRGYFQTMPSVGYMGYQSGYYVRRHNAFPFLSDVKASVSEQDNQIPWTSTNLASDIKAGNVANYTWLIPDLIHDGHDGSSTSTALAAADNYLKAQLPPLLSSSYFQPGGDGVLIITFDESDLYSDNSCSSSVSSGCGGHIFFAIIGPNVKRGYSSSTHIMQNDMLRGTCDLLGISCPGDGASGIGLREFFQ